MRKQPFGCQLKLEQLKYYRAASIKTGKSINQLIELATLLLQAQAPISDEEVNQILSQQLSRSLTKRRNSAPKNATEFFNYVDTL